MRIKNIELPIESLIKSFLMALFLNGIEGGGGGGKNENKNIELPIESLIKSFLMALFLFENSEDWKKIDWAKKVSDLFVYILFYLRVPVSRSLFFCSLLFLL